MSSLHTTVDQGILYEEQFIELYLQVMLDEGFMSYFGENEQKARELLVYMIRESKEHKATLDELNAKLP